MSIHALPDIPGVDVAELIEREMSADLSREAQDNVRGPDGWQDEDEDEDEPAASRVGAETAYYRTVGKRKPVKRSRWHWEDNR